MGIRETFNKHPKGTISVVSGVVLMVIIVLWRSADGGGHENVGTGTIGNRAYFSSDDGKTWFADDAKKIPPFRTDGKETFRAYVFKCPDGKLFVAYLERYTPEAKKILEAALANRGRSEDPMALQIIQRGGVEVKAPGQAEWIKQAGRKAMTLLIPRCPGGGEPTPVLP